MKKKIIAICLCVALVAVGIVGATLAYFTDKDQLNNTFAIGNVDIDLYELTDAYPEMIFQKELKYSEIMPGDELSKKPYIKNESETNAAYVRVAVLVNNYLKINEAIDEVYENAPYNYNEAQMQDLYTKIFDGWGIDYTKNPIRGSMAKRSSEIDVNNDGATLLGIDYVRGVSGQYQSGSEGTAYMEGFSYGPADGKYYENAYLEDGRLYVFYLKLEPGKQYQLFNGLNVPADFTGDQLKMFDGLKIDIYADAIQVDNFTDTIDEATGAVTTSADVNAFNALEAAHPLGWWNTAE